MPTGRAGHPLPDNHSPVPPTRLASPTRSCSTKSRPRRRPERRGASQALRGGAPRSGVLSPARLDDADPTVALHVGPPHLAEVLDALLPQLRLQPLRGDQLAPQVAPVKL